MIIFSAYYDDCNNVQYVGGNGYADNSNNANNYYCADLDCGFNARNKVNCS